ncbi:MAG: D-tyrosyl-tRNA(Tyr) deacylase [Chloroflexi bacterium]|nr:D-tyrosyl-tRNA(Tyr) deacylase [Chloroflexota bacterium]
MRAVCQRVSQASVAVDGEIVGAIGPGVVVLVGIGPSDGEAAAAWLADKVAGMRIFDDRAGRMNLAAADAGSEILIVSQFTLYADTDRGRRPGFSRAAPPALAAPLVERCVSLLRQRGLRVATGRFGAVMALSLVNDGPVTIVLSDDGWA